MSYDGPVPPMYGDPKKLCARVDINRESKVDGVNLGETVSIMVRGKVKAMRGPEERIEKDYSPKGKDKERKVTYPGSVEIEVEDFKVVESDKFDGMLEDY